MSDEQVKRGTARELANQAVACGKPLDWFEELYKQANGDWSQVPWADLQMNPNLEGWIDRSNLAGDGRTALVIGCGLGDDVEALTQRGFEAVGFDISETAIAHCSKRFASSRSQFVVANLLDELPEWSKAFDFVFEAYTLQVLPRDLRKTAIEKIASFVAPRGTLLVITRGRDADDDPGSMPWPLLRTEINQFKEHGLDEVAFEDYVEQEQPPVRRFRIEYRSKSYG